METEEPKSFYKTPPVRVVLLYCAEIWTLLKADVNRLQAFHMRSLRCILEIRWFDYITHLEVKDRTRLEDIEPRVRRRRLALFDHVARMQPGIPAHDLCSRFGPQ